MNERARRLWAGTEAGALGAKKPVRYQRDGGRGKHLGAGSGVPIGKEWADEARVTRRGRSWVGACAPTSGVGVNRFA